MLAYQANNNNNNGWFLDGSIGFEPGYSALAIPYMTEHLGFIDPSTPSTSTPSCVGDVAVAKKLNHNASERDRRKKMNSFYSSLRSLLPPADKKKKLSIPATVSWVLKYIPELQQQVHSLNRQKDHLLSKKVSKQTDHRTTRRQRSSELEATTAVSVSRLMSQDEDEEEEVVFQISKEKTGSDNTVPFSEILGNLEKDGFFPMNASTFETIGFGCGGASRRRVFYTIHVKCGRNMAMESEALREKMVSYCEQKQAEPIGKINIPYSSF